MKLRLKGFKALAHTSAAGLRLSTVFSAVSLVIDRSRSVTVAMGQIDQRQIDLHPDLVQADVLLPCLPS